MNLKIQMFMDHSNNLRIIWIRSKSKRRAVGRDITRPGGGGAGVRLGSEVQDMGGAARMGG